MEERALSNLKVVENAEHISGPYCTKLMADLGAEVIKVEPPVRGDRSRRCGPFPGDVPHPERSGLFLYLNSNKLGITLDSTKATGQKLFRELVRDADILVQNYPPKMVHDLGLDYENLRGIDRRLIMVSIGPMGSSGPYKDYKCHAINTSAASGFMHHIGDPKREPLMPPADQANYYGAIHGAAAAMVALWERRQSGVGQHVDISESECMGSMLIGHQATGYIFGSNIGARGGNRTAGAIYPYVILPCKDGFISMIAMEDSQWDRFVDAVGEFDWAKDPKFANRFSRREHADELDALLAPWLMSHNKDEIFALCRAHRIPFAPICSTRDLVDSQHLAGRDYFKEIDHPQAGMLTYPGAPYKFSETPWAVRRPAPRLGEHNEEILGGRLGLAKEELARLYKAGII